MTTYVCMYINSWLYTMYSGSKYLIQPDHVYEMYILINMITSVIRDALIFQQKLGLNRKAKSKIQA